MFKVGETIIGREGYYKGYSFTVIRTQGGEIPSVMVSAINEKEGKLLDSMMLPLTHDNHFVAEYFFEGVIQRREKRLKKLLG
ncbi:MAG: hypothetical protein SLAVMIC_00243 [uncultured marine phage]|uniref:Uncharacterized protein n=1 Tax=uncultured marine phage TaxID=707152 RepID=A0A8D9C8K9_9VIRU|nr:MAG: hypothetical protein SLAVMIC_00243 [uncultured marine phage]